MSPIHLQPQPAGLRSAVRQDMERRAILFGIEHIPFPGSLSPMLRLQKRTKGY